MYTVLLVDDEVSVLETLKSSIQWQQFGIDTLLTAADGCQALEVIHSQRVDLLITDIRMPNMDGMELLQKVRTVSPDTHCILLTAYGEFEYAREAVKLGVENYLLKPMQADELEETIEKAIHNIYANGKNTKLLFRNNILLRWVTGSISSEELSERSTLLDINIYLPCYSVLCLKKKQKSGSLAAFCALCVEELSKTYDVYQFSDDKGRYVFVIGGQDIRIKHLSSKIRELAVRQDVRSLVAIAAGAVVQGSDAVYQSYQAASNISETADFSGEEFLLTEDSFPDDRDDFLEEAVLALYREKEEGARSAGFSQFAENLFVLAEGGDANRTMSKLLRNLFYLFLREFPNKTGIKEQISRRVHLFSAMPSKEEFISNVVELMDYGYLLFRYCFEQLSPVIQHAISYIHKHYAESLSIKEFCVKKRMSTAYLGYLFKKETGMFFNNYLTQFRICCSVQLLKDSDAKINDIARQVGFSSTSYFISCFKKQTGLSPTKYLEMQLHKEKPNENADLENI